MRFQLGSFKTLNACWLLTWTLSEITLKDYQDLFLISGKRFLLVLLCRRKVRKGTEWISFFDTSKSFIFITWVFLYISCLWRWHDFSGNHLTRTVLGINLFFLSSLTLQRVSRLQLPSATCWLSCSQTFSKYIVYIHTYIHTHTSNIYLSIYLSIFLSIYLSIYLFDSSSLEKKIKSS